MSLGFPAVFKQFWLHFRKNFKKNLWRKSNVLLLFPSKHFFLNERLYLCSIRFDLRKKEKKKIGDCVSGLGNFKQPCLGEDCWPSAICKFGCFQWQAQRPLSSPRWGTVKRFTIWALVGTLTRLPPAEGGSEVKRVALTPAVQKVPSQGRDARTRPGTQHSSGLVFPGHTIPSCSHLKVVSEFPMTCAEIIKQHTII